MDMEAILARGPVIPVLVIDRVADAVPLGQALMDGGLTVLEITLRTPAALEAIAEMRAALPHAIIGAGTVVDSASLEAAVRAGASFIVSPGLTERLTLAARDCPIPLLPGIATPGELMTALDADFRCMKFFPAEAAGGPAMLNALNSPFPHVRFCPTGGISPERAPAYLALPNVVCIGGSWMAPQPLIRAGDWKAITHLARNAANLIG